MEKRVSFSPAFASRLLADVAKGRNAKNTQRGLRPGLGVNIYAVKPEADIAEGSEGSCKIQKREGGAFVEVAEVDSILIYSTAGTLVAGTVYFAARDPFGSWYASAGGGTSVRIIQAVALEDVNHSTDEFGASWAVDIVGGPDSYSVAVPHNVEGNQNHENALRVKNLYFGVVYDETDPTQVVPIGSSLIFALKRGMNFLCVLGNDGFWHIFQSGGVLDKFDWYENSGGGGPVEP